MPGKMPGLLIMLFRGRKSRDALVGWIARAMPASRGSPEPDRITDPQVSPSDGTDLAGDAESFVDEATEAIDAGIDPAGSMRVPIRVYFSALPC